MKTALLVLTVGSFTAFAEQFSFLGTIEKLTKGQIVAKTPRGSFPMSVDDKTEVVKDKSYRGVSVLKAGDEISARCEPNNAGKLVAVKIWANVVTFRATVKEVAKDRVEVVTRASSDLNREERRILYLYPDTVFGASQEDLAPGQDIRVVGLDVGNGAVDASRIALYNTDVPVRARQQ